jgi:hypothetical protein
MLVSAFQGYSTLTFILASRCGRGERNYLFLLVLHFFSLLFHLFALTRTQSWLARNEIARAMNKFEAHNTRCFRGVNYFHLKDVMFFTPFVYLYFQSVGFLDGLPFSSDVIL